jgi:hypothetical protein
MHSDRDEEWQGISHVNGTEYPFFHDATVRGVNVPIVLPLLVLGVITVTQLRRIPHQFSLRTLLIAITFVAMVLGLLVWLG